MVLITVTVVDHMAVVFMEAAGYVFATPTDGAAVNAAWAARMGAPIATSNWADGYGALKLTANVSEPCSR
jgi:hypothetical protein